jgi:hypothetical protein
MLDFAIKRGAIMSRKSPVETVLAFLENHWNAPAAWRAVVRDGLIAEWQVYADNQSARKIMGVQNP